MNTLIYDGNNLAFRANSVMELKTKSGIRTSAIYGVLNSISKDLSLFRKRGIDIDEVIFSWDCGKSKRRLDLYPEYKANRKKQREKEEDKQKYADFIQQTSIIHEFLPSLGIKSIKIKGWESDDIMYGLTVAIQDRQDEENSVIIVSTDEDFLQLVSQQVSVFSPIKDIHYTYENFKEKFGISLEGFLSFKILLGDSSDNISGIQGIGEKTGKSLIDTYGDLPGILSHKNDLTKSKVTSRIFTEEGLLTLDRNLKLIGLEDNVDLTPIYTNLQECLRDQPYIDNKEVKSFLMKYQLSSILVKYPEWIREFKQLNKNYYA